MLKKPLNKLCLLAFMALLVACSGGGGNNNNNNSDKVDVDDNPKVVVDHTCTTINESLPKVKNFKFDILNKQNLNWDAVAGATKYKIYIAAEVQKGESPFAANSLAADNIKYIYKSAYLNANSVNVAKLTAMSARGKTYHIKIAAQDENCNASFTYFSFFVAGINDTNVSKCTYGATATMIDCQANNFSHKYQDGNIGTGNEQLQTMKFSKLKDFADKCVVDERTGLLWELKQSDASSIHYLDTKFAWNLDNPQLSANCNKDAVANCSTVADFIKITNELGWCGYNDWRLPTPSELMSIVDFSKSNAMIAAVFTDVSQNATDIFWSSYLYDSDPENNPSKVWTVNFFTGRVVADSKAANFKARLVR